MSKQQIVWLCDLILAFMTENPLPSSLYEGLLEKLVIVLELAQKNEGVVTPSAKQAILQATNDFKSALNRAKDLAANLPGGELRIEEQDEIIEMLETLKSRKRELLYQFSAKPLLSSATTEQKMEIDSMASTPFHD